MTVMDRVSETADEEMATLMKRIELGAFLQVIKVVSGWMSPYLLQGGNISLLESCIFQWKKMW
jgi:hypothetical protein